MAKAKPTAGTKKNTVTVPKASARNKTVLVCVLLALVTFLVFSPALLSNFVNYDDPDYFTHNRHVRNGFSREKLVWAFTETFASNWHPLTWLSHMLDGQLFGENPTGPHAVNVFFHVANTLLVFLLLKSMTGAMWRSASVAALFALHPVHVESVAWIAERKDVLSTFFFLLTLAAYVRHSRSAIGNFKFEAGSRLSALGYYFLALFLFSLGLMSKPMLVTTPFVLLLLDYWPLNRFELKTQSARIKTLVALLLEKIPFLVLAGVSSVITLIAQRKGGAVTSVSVLSFNSRIENALVSYARYIGKAFWPVDLSVLYPCPQAGWRLPQVVLDVAILIALTIAVVWFARHRKYLLTGWLWFLGTLVPVIGLVQVGIQSMADRYTYIPLLGIFIAVTWFVTDTTQKLRTEKILPIAAIFILATCASLTVRQISHWQSSETLFAHAIAVTENNYPAHNNLGHALLEKGNYAEAIPHFLAALRVNPDRVEVHNNLGSALASLGKNDEAIEHYKIALMNDPTHADAHNNLGIALAMEGKLSEAIEEFNAALTFKPDNANAHINLGNAYFAQRKFGDAFREYQTSLRIEPKDAQAHNNLGNVLLELDRHEEAVAHYRTSLEFQRQSPEPHFNLGRALLRLGRRDEAALHFTEALRLKPDHEKARRQLRALTNSTPQ